MESHDHDFGQWTLEKYSVSGITHSYRVRLSTGRRAFTSALDPNQEANMRLIAAAPRLLISLERAFDILDGIAEILLYQEGQPVTFLESRELEEIYSEAVSELAPLEMLIREARGHT